MSKADEEVTIFFCAGISPNNEISNGLQEEPIKIQRQCPLILMIFYILAVRVALKTSNGLFLRVLRSRYVCQRRNTARAYGTTRMLSSNVHDKIPPQVLSLIYIMLPGTASGTGSTRPQPPHASSSSSSWPAAVLCRVVLCRQLKGNIIGSILPHDSGPPCGASGRASPAVPGPCGMHWHVGRGAESEICALY